ncbi:MAG: PilZ domain-containing protein [Candidatus Rokubacteria bacterium]|nr:PilZ domain-containing protein [Candidatus Rokubacteria bacterium]
MKQTDIKRLKKRLREAARAQRELEKRMFHLKTLYDLSREIGFLIDTQAIMTNLLMMVIGTFGTFRGVILLIDTERASIEAVAQRGLDDQSMRTLAEMVQSGRFTEVMRHGGPIELVRGRGASSQSASAPAEELLASLDLRVWIPFTIKDHLKSGIGLGEKMTGEPYTPDDLELLTILANQASVAIQNATAHEEVVRYAEELAASLKRIQILESIKTNLAKFVPKTVQDLIEESPEAPSLDKREADLSVLFADITGYTRLSAQMDLDRVNQLVEVYFGAFLDEIVKYGGDVNETAGDGLMVIFRDPDPRQHATAAVLAALGIQRRTREVNATLEGLFEPIKMHVGVNSGIAAVGATKIEGAAGTRWTYTASGPTTNIAARLSALGEGGAVVISEETRRRLGDGFEADDLGPQSLKNVAQPIRVFRLVPADREPALAARRRHPRRPVFWPVRLWIGDESFDGRAVDASLHGIRLTDVPTALLEVGKSYRLDLGTDRQGEFTCLAQVRNITDGSVGLETKEPLPI